MDRVLGGVLKKLRESKNVEAKELAGEELSYPQLMKFEKGQTSLTIEKLFYLTRALNVSADEVERSYYKNADLLDLILNRQVDKAFRDRNVAKLKHLLEEMEEKVAAEPKVKRYFLNKMEIQAAIKALDRSYKISGKDVAELLKYLKSVKEWGRYEIWLFSNCAGLFKDQDLRILVNKMMHPELHNFEQSDETQARVNRALLGVISLLIENKHFAPIQEYFEYLESHIKSDFYLYERATLTYSKALLAFRQQPTVAHLAQVEKCIAALELFGCFDLVNLANAELQQYRQESHI